VSAVLTGSLAVYVPSNATNSSGKRANAIVRVRDEGLQLDARYTRAMLFLQAKRLEVDGYANVKSQKSQRSRSRNPVGGGKMRRQKMNSMFCERLSTVLRMREILACLMVVIILLLMFHALSLSGSSSEDFSAGFRRIMVVAKSRLDQLVWKLGFKTVPEVQLQQVVQRIADSHTAAIRELLIYCSKKEDQTLRVVEDSRKRDRSAEESGPTLTERRQ
jgi:hypothetical protein